MQYEEIYLKCGLWEAGYSIKKMPPHRALSIRQFLAKYSIYILPQYPSSPDLSPPNIFPSAKLNTTLKGREVQTLENITTNVTNDLKEIAQTPFQQCFQKWKSSGKTYRGARGLFGRG
jgi:hypothetical protein